MGPGGTLDRHVAAAEDGLVDVAVASLAEEPLVGEAIRGGFEVSVVELLNFDGFFLGRQRRRRRV